MVVVFAVVLTCVPMERAQGQAEEKEVAVVEVGGAVESS